MILDTSKKYTFSGDVYAFLGYYWSTRDWSWSPSAFQHFADNELVTEVKEPRVIKGENRVVSTGVHSYQILPFLPEGTWNIEYTATEVL